MLADEAALPFVEAQDNARALPQLYGSPVSYRRSLVLPPSVVGRARLQPASARHPA